MDIEATVEEQDLDALRRLLLQDEARVRRERFQFLGRRGALMLAVLVAVLIAFGRGESRDTTVRVVAATVVLAAAYLGLTHLVGGVMLRRRVASVTERVRRDRGGRIAYSLTPQGLRYAGDAGRGVAVWSSVAHVVDADDCVFVFPLHELPHIIPKRAFASPSHADEFLRRAKEYAAEADRG